MSQEDQLTCRICSAPAEPDQPLFHPCRCSGSIRYIHQDCLKTWLAHSKKKTCDICKYPYTFEKVYSPDMPERLPTLLLIKQLSRQAFSTTTFCLRVVVVATVWLALVPWATIWTWRMYFTFGTSTAWWISGRLDEQPRAPTNASSHNTSKNLAFSNTTSLLSHPVVRSISSDIVSGQIIASAIVLAFVAVFLLREWIVQNARPGIFEGVEIPPADALQDQPPLPVGVPMEIPAEEPPPLMPPPLAPPAANGHIFQEQDLGHRPPIDEDEPYPRVRKARRVGGRPGDPYYREPLPRSAQEKGKRAEHRERMVGVVGPVRSTRVTKRQRRSLRESSESPEEEPTHTSTAVEAKPRLRLREEQTRFTFRAPSGLSDDSDNSLGDDAVSDDMRSKSLSRDPISDTSLWDSSAEAQEAVEARMPRSTNPDVPEDVTSLVSPIDAPTPTDLHVPLELPSPILASPPSDGTLSDDDGEVPPSHSLAPRSSGIPRVLDGSPRLVSSSPSVPDTPNGLRRPPLPSVTLPSPSSGLPPSVSASRGPTPLASPSLATYSAPEEFEAGPSNLSGYFGRRTSDAETQVMQAEHDRYFATEEEATEIGDDEEGTERADGPDTQEHLEVGIPAAQEQDALGVEQAVEDGPAQREALQRMADEARALGVRINDLEQRLEVIQDNIDENMEDDMDGALEAIGLRGPLHAVVQNAALMTFILDVTIGLGIWVPYTLGKTTALLSLDPPRFLFILHLPLRLIRLVTDPIVDGIALFLTKAVLPSVFRALYLVFSPLLRLFTRGSAAAPDPPAETTIGMFGFVQDLIQRANGSIVGLLSPTAKSTTTEPSSRWERIVESDSPVFRYIEPYFAPLGSKVRTGFQDGKVTWTRLASGDGPNERIFAVLLGYFVVALLVALYLNVLTIGNVRNAGKAVRSAVRQQLLVVKVASFIVVELVVFPLGCGVMLDACAIILVPQSSFHTGAAFLAFAPVTSVFYHWVIGTMFMYQFAVLLAGCRDIMRPGSMWFIKDPQDQNFHPIRDILERPTLVQIRKLLLSGAMYSLVIAAGVGTVSGMLQLFSKTVLPLRWKIREPISPVPVDLLFLHLVLPYTMQYFRPRKAVKQIGTSIWKTLAARLRLSSYMFGERHPEEEFTPRRWWQRIFTPKAVGRSQLLELGDGTFRRVPNRDNIVLVKDIPATALVNRDGKPINEEQARIIAAQDAEAVKNKRNVKDDYTVVYLPPNLRYRVAAFIFAVWTMGSIMLALTFAAPILLGRSFFGLFTSNEVHDGYAYIAGFYLLWGCYLTAHSIDRMDKRRQRRGGLQPRAQWPLYIVKRSLLWVAQTSYMAVFLGVVIPTLLALVMEFYIVRPLRSITRPPPEHRIRIVDMWALGLLYSKIFIRVLRMQPNNDIMKGIDQISRGGWAHIDPFRATRDVIAPLTCGLLGMLLFPAGALYLLRKLFNLHLADDFLFLHVYPSIFTVAGFGHTAFVVSRVFGSWSQAIRDKEYLVEMRLQNHEPELDLKRLAEFTKSTDEFVKDVQFFLDNTARKLDDGREDEEDVDPDEEAEE